MAPKKRQAKLSTQNRKSILLIKISASPSLFPSSFCIGATFADMTCKAIKPHVFANQRLLLSLLKNNGHTITCPPPPPNYTPYDKQGSLADCAKFAVR